MTAWKISVQCSVTALATLDMWVAEEELQVVNLEEHLDSKDVLEIVWNNLLEDHQLRRQKTRPSFGTPTRQPWISVWPVSFLLGVLDVEKLRSDFAAVLLF